jgi:maleate isomerase
MLKLPYELEAQRAPQIGLVVLQADERIEHDMRQLMPGHVEVLVSRVPSGTHVTLESLAAMEVELQRAASLFPLGAQFSAIGYGCTSGSAQIGTDRVALAIKDGATAPHVTEPVSAVIAACRHLGVKRLGLLSPYIESVTARLCDVLTEAGIEVCAFASFNESEEWRVARITPESIKSAAAKLAASADMDAIFISCTNLSTLGIISDLEANVGMPILTSNQVLAWDLLRLANIELPKVSAGQLWKR